MSRRQEKKQKLKRQRKNRIILFIAAAAVLCAGYVLACAMPEDGKIVKNTYINGTDVSGMTREQAAEKVQKTFERDYEDAVLTVKAAGENYQIKMYPCLTMNVGGASAAAVNYAHGTFLSRGFELLKAALFDHDVTWNPSISSDAALTRCIETAGLTAINTTVQTTYEVKGGSLIFQKGKTGVSVDTVKLSEAIKKAVSSANYDAVIESPMVKGKVDAVDMQAVYDSIHTKKANATLNPKKDYKIVKSVKGVKFNVDSARETFDAAAEGEQVVIPLEIKKPEITTKKLKKYLFRDVLGSCTTNVSGSSARVSNVALAAKTLNGIILLPGESFSYNDALGERTEEKGYQKAPAYSNGQSVQELGGGICQVSSTLYKAALLSNLKITEHHNHSYVSSYIGIGMDATVSWGGPDLKFKNDTDYPVKIAASYSGGQITCKIYGAKLDKKQVKMTAETLQVNSCGTVYEDDPDMEKGTSVVVSSGHDGYVVQTYRNIYNGKGKKISSEKEAYCVYKTKDRVVRVGTKETAPQTDGMSGAETVGQKETAE